jgi:hypothetical protein
MKANPDLKIGSIVQINPDHKDFGGDFCIVTEVLAFGIQGYLALIYPESFKLTRYKGIAYLRIKWEHIELVGYAEWQRKIVLDETDEDIEKELSK